MGSSEEMFLQWSPWKWQLAPIYAKGNHTMAWVAKAHSAHPAPTPCYVMVANQQPRLPRATSSLALNACRDGASTASLGNLFSASPPLGEKLPPTIQP